MDLKPVGTSCLTALNQHVQRGCVRVIVLTICVDQVMLCGDGFERALIDISITAMMRQFEQIYVYLAVVKQVGSFDTVTIATYRAAEKTGDLAGACESLAKSARRQASVRARRVSTLASPQSITCTSPKVPTMMLAGLRSRCMTPRLWA